MKTNIQKGFTIIETLVATSILVVAVMGALSAVQSGLSSYIYSKDQIIAFYLAQEAYEQIRNLRDENNLIDPNGTSWLNRFAGMPSDPCYFGKKCIVSSLIFSGGPNGVAECPSGICDYLRQDSATGVYGYNNAWPLTQFRREVRLSSVNTNEIVVSVNVYWNKGTVARQFKIRGNLLNW